MFNDFSYWFKSKIQNNLVYNVRQVLYIVSIWVFVTFFFVYIKFYDIPQQYLTEIYRLNTEIPKKWLYQIALFIGASFGLVMGFLHVFVYPYIERIQKLAYNILLRISVFVMLSHLVYLTILYIYGFTINVELISQIFSEPTTINILLYALITEAVVSLIIQLRRNLGRKYFVNIVKNTYRNPKEEHRVFMFLDLEDSTPTANEMGHLNFSRYIQDCFWDLSDITLMHGAEIYQFVGDEAVITWKVSKDFDYEKCIALYFNYKDLLDQKKHFYQKKYNHTPNFRCSIHSGEVSAALVGDYKKEIAYHGNVLNLGSRLQKNCKEHNADVLISENFFSNLKNHWYSLTPIVLQGLKGIDDVQTVYKVGERDKKYYFYS